MVAVVVYFAWISGHEQKLEDHQLTCASYLSIFPMIVTVVLRPMLRRTRRLPHGVFDNARDGVHSSTTCSSKRPPPSCFAPF
ncbi:hypothetical protein M405DRAFT_409381 [Rhizopogon salebrosus TDB-379]|nr:hypothetical protein M405DRAFT_409381 [Rhizopogon salebrosus TDB-379]